MDRFSEQLANLQRAASRAGTDNNDGNNNSGNDNNNGRSYRRDDNYNSNYNHRRDRERRHDDRYYSSHPRKRGRYDDGRSYDDRGRFYNNDHRGGRYNGNYRHDNNGGRDRDGRWRDNNYESNNQSNRDQRSNNRQTETLAELVSNVKTKYQASQNSLVGNEEKVAHADKRRHIALLFLTIDDLPHEHIWREWLKSCTPNEDVGESATNSSAQDNLSSVQNDTPLVSVLCHAKFPDRIKSEWLRQRHLMKQSQSHNQVTKDDNMPRFHSHRPEWGSVEITRAMIDLVEEALRIGTSESAHSMKYLATQGGDGIAENNASTNEAASTGHFNEQDIPRVDRFIFVSESCLPVTTLEEVEMALFGPKTANDSSKSLYDKSWVNARSTPNNGYAKQQQWDAIRIDNIPRDYIWKADQWMMLTRRDAEAVVLLPSQYLNGQELWPVFRKCRASDEIYFPTTLSILGIISRRDGEAQVDDFSKGESCAGHIRRRRITYCDWSLSAKNPASFTSHDWRDIALKARNQGCLFARKFVLLSSLRDEVKKNQLDDTDGVVSVEEWSTVVVNKKMG